MKPQTLGMIRPCPADVVFEVGCERGGLSERVAGSCRHLVCVDINTEVLGAARERLHGWMPASWEEHIQYFEHSIT